MLIWTTTCAGGSICSCIVASPEGGSRLHVVACVHGVLARECTSSHQALAHTRACLQARAVRFPSRSVYGQIGYNRKALSHIIFFLLSSDTSGSSRISCTATA